LIFLPLNDILYSDLKPFRVSSKSNGNGIVVQLNIISDKI